MKSRAKGADTIGVLIPLLTPYSGSLAARLRSGPAFIVVLLSLLSPSARATPEAFDGFVRVGLRSAGGKTVTAALSGPADVRDARTMRRIGALKAGTVAFTLRNGKVGLPAFSLASSDGLRIEPKDRLPFRIGKRTYRGALEVWKEGATLIVVNEVDLEEYVFGSLLLEGAPSLHPEAQKALAVAIRTYAERTRGKHNGGLFDSCDTTHCQGYAGTRTAGAEWARRAQTATTGEVLLWDDGPIWSLYSTDCGGATANNEDAGMGEVAWPYLRGVPAVDPATGRDYCAASPFHRWTRDVSFRQLETLLNRRAQTRVGRLMRVAVDRTDPFGRAITVRFEGRAAVKPVQPSSPAPAVPTGGRTVIQVSPSPSGEASPKVAPPVETQPTLVRMMKAADLRALLGVSVLKSTLFTVTQVGEAVRFEGRGYGHGVGMCVVGANGMAKAGRDYRNILSRYYSSPLHVRLIDPPGGTGFRQVAGASRSSQ